MSSWFRFFARQCGVAGCAALIGGPAAFAQSTAPSANPKPTAVFSGTSSRGSAGTSGLLVSVSEAYDDNVLADGSAGGIQSGLQEGGLFTDVNATFNLRVGRSRLQSTSSAATNLRYYSEQHTTVGVGHYGSSEMSYSTDRTSFAVGGGVAYAPSYLYKLFATVAPTPPPVGDTAPGYAVTDTSSVSYDARVAVTRNLSPRNRLMVRTGGHYTDYLETQVRPALFALRDLGSYEVATVFSRSVDRNFNLNIGYTYRRAQYFTGAFPTEHDVSFGFDYVRPHSRTRSTRIRMSIATAMLDGMVPGDYSGPLTQQYKGTVDANVSRQLARTWQVTGAYRRGVDFIEGFAAPILTDGASISTTGQMSRRVDFLAAASYSVGEPFVLGQTRGFTTYAANARLRRALNADWALFGEYLYYYYDFSQGFVPIGVPPTMSRNSVRVGLMLWVPVGGR